MATQSNPEENMNDSSNQVATRSAKGERLMQEFLKFRDMLQASSATKEQKDELWRQFLTLYTGVF